MTSDVIFGEVKLPFCERDASLQEIAQKVLYNSIGKISRASRNISSEKFHLFIDLFKNIIFFKRCYYEPNEFILNYKRS